MRTDVHVGEELKITIKFQKEAGGRLRTRVVMVWRNTWLAPTVRSLSTSCGVLFEGIEITQQLQAAFEVFREKGLLVEEKPPEESTKRSASFLDSLSLPPSRRASADPR